MQKWREGENQTQAFYDSFWARNIPDIQKAMAHTLRIVPDRTFQRGLDAGCGTGVSSLALLERAKTVVSLDLSPKSLGVAKALADNQGKVLELVNGSLMNIPFADESFDLIYCYGVLSLTAEPYKVLNELTRILCQGGNIVLSATEKTNLSGFHSLIQRVCLRMPKAIRILFLKTASAFIVGIGKIWGLTSADYDLSVESKLEDFYFVPYKHYFKVDQMRTIFEKNNLAFELISSNTARFKSASNFIVMGTKRNHEAAKRS